MFTITASVGDKKIQNKNTYIPNGRAIGDNPDGAPFKERPTVYAGGRE